MRADEGSAALVLDGLLEELASLPPLGGWVRGAACRGEAALFTTFPASKTAAERVALICDSCPVRSTCEEYAASYDVDGVWAGSWHNTKTGIQTRSRPRVRLPAACGTYGGYRRHRRVGEPACEPCRAANAAQRRRQYQRQDARAS